MIIDGLYAEYHGLTFKVVKPMGNELLLVTEEDYAEDLGFTADISDASPHTLYFKTVAKDDVDRLYDLTHEARYEGYNYIGTDNQDKALSFGLEPVKDLPVDGYYSKRVTDDEIEKIVYRKDVE
ncbi:hypothetical protein NW132_11570 [Staphylococcus pettenkoferi]|uniref:hypothetical protein n=1 Tax=Staphylococcus pettenkoferi TaxID=170573 RepID=UPI0022748374|nr:hypothetical protein [Staphylococcus pettenkoferi]MCY1609793.1 hypothetical protein [Staphylococcus pettenkoferi]